ncbi:hypothetical protein J6396_23535 [Pseudomonas aeruginosa]|uniref:hypothetical protein n=2 Tax=Pseudomonas aeruginosa TaxID=287 RepID=UPI000EB5E214|nr:hypothetical protein [Pseudomonas aeruginosa]MBO8040620.1 hypothetical protein [Pseudomonas aeruginosa]
MQYDGLAWAFALLALLAALVAVRILFERTWFLGWLRGTCGLAFVAVAALLLVLAWDLRSYSLLKPEQPMATLSFQAEGPQRYRVLIQEGANERSVVLDGELWQLDARIFRWKGLAALIGLAPGYRLDALSGRFLALEQQSRGRRLGLSQSPLGVDLWRWLRAGEHDLFLFEPLAGGVTFLPMADKAVFAVNYGVAGLLAEPMNLAAEEALRDWR